MFNVKELSHPFSKLVIVYIFWLATGILAGSLFEVYFFGLGLSIQEIVATSFFWFVGSLILIPLFKRFDSKKFMLIGIFITFISILVLYNFNFKEAAYLYRLLLSLTILFFWMPFNISFYEFRKENNALLGALYFSLGPLLLLVLPAVSGVIAASLGYGNLYLLAMISCAITFVLGFLFLEERVYTYDLVKSLKSISGLRSLIFLEGFGANMIASVTLETMLLKYATKPIEFGSFISLTTVFSILASFLTAKISDNHKRRREFVLLSSVALGIATIFASTAGSIEQFFLAFSLVNFFKTIFFPFPFAVVVDNSKNLVSTMIAREYMLNFGRICGAIMGFALLFYFDISSFMLVNGATMLIAYPLAFELKKRKLEKI